MARPVQESAIIFSSNSNNFSEVLSALKRSTLSISNRLKSICQDADFVCSVADSIQLPLVANERCGSWYIPLERKAGSAYFKSTDGHMNEWSFSLRRLNTQVLDIVGKHNGCIIVDSTRRGKRIPDALSKTVPIWCCVLNRIFFPNLQEAHTLYTAPMSVSASEHAQIDARLAGFVRQVEELDINLSSIRAALHKPLRPVWVTRETDLTAVPAFEDFHRVVLCTASRRVPGGEVSEGGYVQGAGDDAEGWSNGLTASLFWKHKAALLTSADEGLPELISQLLASPEKTDGSAPVRLKPTTWLLIGSEQLLEDRSTALSGDAIIHCGAAQHERWSTELRSRYLHLKCNDGKIGSRDLRKELSKLIPFVSQLRRIDQLVICCPSGKDLSLGVALAVICLYADPTGQMMSTHTPQRIIDKSYIRRRLAWITTAMPTVNPSRATLQSVNSYLMSSTIH